MLMILVTGATGQLGKATIDFLLKKTDAKQIAALARDPKKAEELKQRGIDVRIGDYKDYASLVEAFKGIEKLLLISSNDIVDRTSQHLNAVRAAKEAGVKHVIYTSFQRRSSGPPGLAVVMQAHVETEKALAESGLAYTFFKNGYYMDMVPDLIGRNVLQTGTIFFPAGNGKVNFVLRRDIAEGLAHVLTTSGHENKAYEIGSDTTYSFADIAAILSELTGKKIQYVSPPLEVYKQELAKHNVPPVFIEMLANFGQFFAEGGMDVPDPTLGSLLGRKPTGMKEFLKSVYLNHH
jgi:NAD(P)H dehydrogenase (quinone)